MGHARCEELMGFNMGLASVCEGGEVKRRMLEGLTHFVEKQMEMYRVGRPPHEFPVN